MMRMGWLRRWVTDNSVAARAAGVGQRSLTAACVVTAIVLATFQALDPNHLPDPDGISYFDMGDALMRGEWRSAVNSLWSPLYAWVQGVGLWLLKPSMYWEFAAVQLVNLLIFLVALAAFHFCLRELIAFQRDDSPAAGARLPEWAWVSVGYTLFIWSSLALTTVTVESPDMLVAACVYCAAGLSLRIRRGHMDWRTFAALGVTLGLAYMAKAFMFAIAFVIIAVSVAALGKARLILARGATALAVFLLVGSPLIVALSLKQGRPTFSEQGQITYLMHVNHVPFVHWQGDDLGLGGDPGQPIHPSRQIFQQPAVFEFGSPVGGTYPPWFDVGYWFAGAQPAFDLTSHLRILESSLGVYYDIFVKSAGSVLAAGIALWILGGRGQSFSSLARGWSLIIPAAGTLGLFAVVHVEPRYTAAFVTLLLLGLLCGVRAPDTAEARHLMTGLTVGVVAVMLAIAAFQPLGIAFYTARELARGRDPWPRENYQVAEGLQQLGLKPGDTVAVIGRGFHASGWARLARLRIVAELPVDQVESFWALDEAGQGEVMRALAQTGARVAVATEGLPGSVHDEAWRQLGNTDQFAFVLTP